MTYRILRLSEVKSRTGLSRSTIYLRQSTGNFPKSISLGEHAVGWIEHEIENWLKEQIFASRSAAVDAIDRPNAKFNQRRSR